jgi:hypothetical protein
VPIATAALVISALIFGPLSSYLAGRRARSPLVWFGLGVIIGPMAIILLLLAPPGRCPDCAARVHGWSQTCASCGARLSGAVEVQGEAPDAAAAERPLVVRPVGGSVATTGSVDAAVAMAAADARPVLTVVPPPPSDRALDATPTLRTTRDRSWEVASPAAAAAAGAERAQAHARGRRPEDVVDDNARIVGSAIFLGGRGPSSTNVVRLAVGDRYGLARDGDELQVLGPVTVDPERIVARIPIRGAEVELSEDRLVVQGGPSGRGTMLAFTGLSVQRGTDVVGILRTPSDEARA